MELTGITAWGVARRTATRITRGDTFVTSSFTAVLVTASIACVDQEGKRDQVLNKNDDDVYIHLDSEISTHCCSMY